MPSVFGLDAETEGIAGVRQAKLGIFRRWNSFAGREPPTRYRNRTLCEVTSIVKLRRGRYQTATQVKVLSPVIDVCMMADCLLQQECNNYMFVLA
jgi:predicted transcriptional regulator